MARLFFALWPDATSRETLARLAADVVAVTGGRPVPAEKIHLTLAFLGEVDAARRALAEEAARRARFAPVRVPLDCVGSFRRARVAWAGSFEAAGPLMALQARLAGELRAAGFVLEERPFTVHVTLARRTERALPRAKIPPVAWEAAEMALVVSRPDGGYENAGTFGKG